MPTTLKVFTKPEITHILRFVLADNKQLFNRWLSRGDGIAVYGNALIEAPVKPKKNQPASESAPDMKFVSYGSPAAQIELAEPPQRLPDIGSAINWRYQLVGVYKGELL